MCAIPFLLMALSPSAQYTWCLHFTLDQLSGRSDNEGLNYLIEVLAGLFVLPEAKVGFSLIPKTIHHPEQIHEENKS
jgi:hypothetical protein